MRYFLSNRVENLLKPLFKNIFDNSFHPFAKRLIIVPSPAMKGWLMRKMAEERGIWPGIQVAYIEEGIEWISGEKDFFPKNTKLKFLIEWHLKQILEKESSIPLWQELVRYLNKDFRKKEKRCVALSEQLAHLFSQYRRYGAKLFLEPLKLGWQGALWERVIGSTLQIEKKSDFSQKQAHLFALSFLSSGQLETLHRYSEDVSIDFYQVSPCKMYWGDLLTDRETRNLEAMWKRRGLKEKPQAELEDYLRSRNPLLSNFGRLGRHMHEAFLDCNEQQEEYVIAKEAAEHPAWADYTDPDLLIDPKPLTLLSALGADLLLLRNPEETGKIPLESAESIQVHSCPTPCRQLEILKNIIFQLLAKEKMEPEDIVVMAPDISLFAPYIGAVFEEAGLEYQVMEVQAPIQSTSVRSFLHLLELCSGRWDAASVIQLFEYDEFKLKNRFNDEEVAALKDWIQKGGILWGLDSGHRNSCLKLEHATSGMSDRSESGTWKEGVDRLLKALTMKFPFAIDEGDADLLGRFIQTLNLLRDKLLPLLQEEKSLKDWSKTFLSLWETFFISDDDQADLLKMELSALSIDLAPFTFYSVATHLRRKLGSERVCYRENEINAIRFCSLLPMRAIPAKAIILLGMDEGVFPGVDLTLSLNLLRNHPQADYCPMQTDYDRYLFLETLLAARDYFIVLYNGVSLRDGKESPPSIVVSELVSYLDEGYVFGDRQFSDISVFLHPKASFDRRYFEKDSPLKNYSSSDYKAALIHYLTEKSPREIYPFARHAGGQEDRIFIEDLSSNAKNPLSVYCREGLGVYLTDDEKNRIKIEEEFALSSLKKAIMKREGFVVGLESALFQEDQKGSMPLGLFKEAAVNDLENEIEELNEAFASFGLSKEDLFDIELTDDVDGSPFKFPPIQLNNCTIVGRIARVCPLGLVSFKKEETEEILKVWPLLLALNILAKRENRPEFSACLFLESKSIKKFKFQNPHFIMEKYVEYYQKCKECPSPLIPEWIDHFVQKEPTEIGDEIKKSLKSPHFFNQHVKWILRGGEFDLPMWSEQARELFSTHYEELKK